MSLSTSVLPAFTIITFLFFHLPSSSSQNVTTSVATPENACNITTDPSFCKSIIPPKSQSTLYGYGKYLVRKSLDQSSRFSLLIDKTIKDNVSLPSQAIGSLKDCLLLSQLTTDFLVSSLTTLNSNDTINLPDAQGDRVQTLLSAIVTNQQTCLDGLSQASFLRRRNTLYAPLVNGTKLYSVSLAMFSHSWYPKHQKKPKKVSPRRGLRDDGVPYWVENPALFQIKSPRRMVQEGDGVLVSDVVYVAQDGTGNFTTIMDAVSAAPNNPDPNAGFFVISVAAGVYNEYVTIDKRKKNVMMIGEGINQTIITGNRSVGGGWTTFNSATLAVVAQGFVAIGITVRNTAGPANQQAVAVRNGADLSVFYQCSFEGYQDTLYTHSMRQFYRECDISGTVDFIFGNSAVVFQNCNLYARLPLQGQSNIFTAQGRTDPNQNTGISVINCTVLAAEDLAGSKGQAQSYLGRPWKQYSRTVFINSFISDVISPAGWLPWSGDFALSTLYYGEYGNIGSGADTSNRVRWPGYHTMNLNDATNFTMVNFVQGDVWLPSTSVPFSAGFD